MNERHAHRHGREGCPLEVHSPEEVLEAIWTAKEEGKMSIEEVLKRAQVEDRESVLEDLIRDDMARTDGGNVFLTEKGELAARKVIRQHRLAEVLLSQVMSLDDERVEDAACRFEHMLNPEVTDSICTLLGHPSVCPHGKPIPRARCCEKFRTDVQPLVQRLSDLAVGQAGRITVIAPRYHSRLGRLSSLGILPGVEVRLRQRFPSFIIDIGETTLAIDSDIADEILVRLTGAAR